eukprot:8836086-Karenia_brevis.AAC.1
MLQAEAGAQEKLLEATAGFPWAWNQHTSLHDADERSMNLDEWRSGKRKRTWSSLSQSETQAQTGTVAEMDSDMELFQDLKEDILNKEKAAQQDEERATKKRKQKPNEACRGRDGVICKFSTKSSGEKARVQPKRNRWYCFFCDPLIFERSLKSRGGQFITKALTYFKEQDINVYQDALRRVSEFQGDEVAEDFQNRVEGLAKRREKEAERKLSFAARWRKALAVRLHARKASKAHRAEHDKDVRKQDKKLRKKFPEVYGAAEARPREAWMSPLARAFQDYANYKSWCLCSQCNRLLPQKFRPGHVRQPNRLQPYVQKCKHCRHGMGYPAPQPADVPMPLRSLPDAVLEALRIFDIDTGLPERAPAGYWVHTNMIRFTWHWRSVEDRLGDLKGREWEAGREAYFHLIAAKESSYRKFQDTHTKVLERRRNQIEKGELHPDAPMPMLPRRFIETVGIECCNWPHLYWRTDMCETYVRSMDSRRLQRERQGKRGQKRSAADMTGDFDLDAWRRTSVNNEATKKSKSFKKDAQPDDSCSKHKTAKKEVSKKPARHDDSNADSEESSDSEDEFDDGVQHQSAKASFMAKVLSPLMGYGTDWYLQQFVYDLWLWSSLGGAKNAAGIPMRGALA